MDRTSYTNLAKSWEYVEDHAFSRQSAELNAIRTAAEEAGIPQGSAAQAELLRMLVRSTVLTMQASLRPSIRPRRASR